MRTTSRVWNISIGVIAAASCFALQPVTAAHAETEDAATARMLFARARAHLRNAEYDKACRLFEESSRLLPRVGTLLNLGDCLERESKLLRALETWRHAAELGESTNDDRAAEARKRQEALEARVPRLLVRLAPDAPADARVTVGNTELGAEALGAAFPVDVGEQVVVVRASGRADTTYRLAVSEGDHKELVVRAGASLIKPKAPPSRPEHDEPERRDQTLAYVIGGVGVAGIAVAAVTGVMILGKKQTINERCTDTHTCDSEGMDAVDSAKALTPINYAAWAVGLAGLGTGTALFLTGRSSGKAESGLSPTNLAGVEVHVRGQF